MSKGLGNMLKQASEMQKRMGKMQAELAEKIVEASAGGGMVTCKVNGKQEVLELTISKEVVNPDDVDMLQDLVVAAVNEAIKKSHDLMNSEMQKIAGGMGLNIPGLF